MLRYFLKRVAVLIPVVLIVSLFSFGLLYMAPSDPITMKYAKRGEMPPAEVIAQEKAALGLDKGFIQQYSNWLSKALQGDWGSSYDTNQPVAEIMKTKLPNTIVLTFSAVLIMLVFAYPLGILAAVYRNKWIDYAIRLFSFWGTAMPTFWLGLLLMYWIGVRLRLLPVMGSGDFKHLILPAVSLAIWLIALYCRRIRSGIVAEINKDYVTGLKARGYSNSRIYLRHIIPNASISILVMLGLSIGDLLGGSMVVEVIFGWQGIGSVALEAVAYRDYVVLQAYVVWMAIIYTFVNLAADMLVCLINPKVRLTEKAV